MRKIYLVPNLVTTANMFCGFFSIVASIENDFLIAAWAILVAAIFDMLDGRIARLAKATSQFGVEYDSLSDLVSFGLAPALLMYQWALEPYGRLGLLASFFYVCCGALRLARFNIHTGKVAKSYFEGVASPIAAGSVSTFVIFQSALIWPNDLTWVSRETWVLTQALGLGSLMVSTIPFPSFKDLNWRSRSSFGYLMVAVLCMILIAVRPEVTLFLLNTAYLVVSLGYSVFRLFKPKVTSVEKFIDAE